MVKIIIENEEEWRLPTLKEIIEIYNNDKTICLLHKPIVWTSKNAVDEAHANWVLDFRNGHYYESLLSNKYYIQLVKSTQSDLKIGKMSNSQLTYNEALLWRNKQKQDTR